MPPTAWSLPRGRVTFVFTDVVGSTRTFIEHGDAYAEALRALHATTAEHASRRNGAVVETEGDGAFLAFPDAASAVDAVSALQEELEAAKGSPGLRLRIRAGAHSGDAVPVDGHYLALAVYVAARVSATANAGQLLVTDTVIDELREAGSRRVEQAMDLGTYSLKDITDAVHIWRLTGDAAPPRATPARRTNVQQSRTSFVGRESDLIRLQELVDQPGLLTIVGPGGIGKTRLVSEFALRYAESFAGGVWMVELATLESADQVPGAVGVAVGLASGGVEDVVMELKRRERTVLILDNCEHLLDPVVDLVEQLLAGCPQLTVVCTSREALRLAGERTSSIRPLSASGAAVELFLDRSHLAPDDEPARHVVEELCAVLDGLPLAIELAASQARTSAIQELLDAVASGADPLTRRGGEPRQRSLDEVLTWSLSQLPPWSRDSLLVLSIFPGRFSPTMSRTVLEAVDRCDPAATRALAAASLIDLDGADYRLLSTIRGAARRHLRQDQELDAKAHEALAHWTASYGAERYEILSYHDDVPQDTILAVETGLAHALETGRQGMGKAWNLMAVLVGARGPASVIGDLADRALDLVPTDVDSALVVQSAAAIVGLCGSRRLPDKAQVQAMLTIATKADDARLLERVLNAAADWEQSEGHWDAALAHRQQILRLAETRSEVRHNLPAALNNLGVYLARRGDVTESEAMHLRAAEAAQIAGFPISAAIAQFNLAALGLESGRPEMARDCALAALKAAPAGWRLRPMTVATLARAYAALDDRAAAVAAGAEALPVLREQAKLDSVFSQELVRLLEAVPELRTP